MAAKSAAAALASALLLGPSLTSAPAGADPDVPVAQLTADQLPPELVQAIQRDLKMSPAEYLDRAARAQELRTYAADFRAQRPDDFAGAWLTPDGKPMVAVTSMDAAKVAAAAGYQTRLAPVSANHLEAAAGQLNDWIAQQPFDLGRAINSVAIDFLNSQLVVIVSNSTVGQLLNLPTLVATVKVVLSPDGGGPVENRPMGGDTYVTAPMALDDPALQQVTVCSFGFNAVDQAGTPLNISAGHCDPKVDGTDQKASVWVPNPDNLGASPQAGDFARATLGGNTALDYSVIKLTDRAVRAGMDRPSVRGANGTTLTLTGTADPVVGAPVCKSGQSSTFTCGFVVADHVETQLFTDSGDSRTIRGFATNACTLSGDSGGPIVTGTLALGITSGSNTAESEDCNAANLDLAAYGGTASLGIPIRRILADVDATSNGGVGAGAQLRIQQNAG
ncbi:protease [Nocardia stercoris]|uniref:Protease n=1 Tax=Nocardia stercoris TaxID=2483361 RepID=A0A3M2L2G9_9NOCA|nr:protease [Nocardia stercoris]